MTGVNKYGASTGINKQTLNVSFVLQVVSWDRKEKEFDLLTQYGFVARVFILM